MVKVTPTHRTLEHKFWHEFDRGMCLNCGWHCRDCPVGVATCKCKPVLTKEELADLRLKEATLDDMDKWND
jgi:hypothetical protein